MRAALHKLDSYQVRSKFDLVGLQDWSLPLFEGWELANVSMIDDKLGQVQSLVRAFGLLDAIACAPMGLTLTEVAKSCGLARSTAHRLLTTMEALRYLRFVRDTNKWTVGSQAFSVGASFADPVDLARLGRPLIRSVLMLGCETVNVSLVREEELVCLEQIAAPGALVSHIKPGSRLPFHATASGKAWLAWMNPAALDRRIADMSLLPLTKRTHTDRNAVANSLANVRVRGFAVDDEEHRLGTRCVASTILNERGVPHAVVSISGAAARFDFATLESLGAKLFSAANALTLDLGGPARTATA